MGHKRTSEHVRIMSALPPKAVTGINTMSALSPWGVAIWLTRWMI
jgi:hypothetical protein